MAYQNEFCVLHFWIEIEDTAGEAWRIDYRARMWCLGLDPTLDAKPENEALAELLPELKEVPHGIFKPGEYPAVEYLQRRALDLELLPDYLVKFMIAPLEFPPPV